MPSDLERLLQAVVAPRRQTAQRSTLITFTESLLLGAVVDTMTPTAGTAGSPQDIDDDLCVGLASP